MKREQRFARGNGTGRILFRFMVRELRAQLRYRGNLDQVASQPVLPGTYVRIRFTPSTVYWAVSDGAAQPGGWTWTTLGARPLSASADTVSLVAAKD